MMRLSVVFSCISACILSYTNGQDTAYRNLALNPDDVAQAGWTPDDGYPHATSNSETRGEAAFYALNAIDGDTSNIGHGAAFPSWGPERRTGNWWRVDFGKPVVVDKMILWIRADFPHDGYWHTGTVLFSDSSEEMVSIDSTADRQVYEFAPHVTEWITLYKLIEEMPLSWCAMTEVEFWGRDAVPGCLDVRYQEYDVRANVHDASMCQKVGISFPVFQPGKVGRTGVPGVFLIISKGMEAAYDAKGALRFLPVQQVTPLNQADQ